MYHLKRKRFFYIGKVFLNSIEHLDPMSDEWTTFLTVPERSITPSKAVPQHIQETSEDIFTSHIMKNDDQPEVIDFKGEKLNEGEGETFFEMDLEPYEIKASCKDTPTVDSSTSTNDDEILEESTLQIETMPSESLSVPENDQIMVQTSEAISKHVLR